MKKQLTHLASATWLSSALLVTLASCSSDSGSDSRNFETLGGTVTLTLPNGYPTSTVNIQLTNGTESKTVSVNAAGGAGNSFTFPTALQAGSSFRVTLQTDSNGNAIHPLGMTCTLTDNTGTIDASSSRRVNVNCTANTYPLSVNVAGLTHGSIELRNGNDTLLITPTSLANGLATFVAQLPYNAPYDIAIAAESLNECVLVGNRGRVQGAATATTMQCTTNELSVLAGDHRQQFCGYLDSGNATLARFCSPASVAISANGTAYVVDNGNHAIRKVTPNGEVTTFVGSGFPGYVNATGTAARLNGPDAIAIDASGTLYVADTGNHAIRRITPTGDVTTFAGSEIGERGFINATGNAARFSAPIGIAIDNLGWIYVADLRNNVIRKISPGAAVSTLAGSDTREGGYVNATGSAARFQRPFGVAVDSSRFVYVADADNHAIRKITPDGAVTTLAGSATGEAGYVNATGSAARFSSPYGITVDSFGTVYVTDSSNHALRKITPVGAVTTLAGSDSGDTGYINATGAAARFYEPWGVTIDNTGTLYVADINNAAIRRVTQAGTVTTFAGLDFGQGQYINATGSAARFRRPEGVAIDASGNTYVSDYSNHAIRKIATNGVVTTLAGSDTGESGFVNASSSNARFYFPEGIAVDAAGNVFVADKFNHAIRRVTPTGMVTTLAGSETGESGYVNAMGTAARFRFPAGLAIDGTGVIYVADYGNHAIRKVSSAGVVTALAGSEAAQFGYVNGTGNVARFNNPKGVAVDSIGNVYVADYYNHALRKITPAGAVSTLAGSVISESGFVNGTGSVARFYYPYGIIVDNAGVVYVTDSLNNAIRKVTPSGEVRTLAGSPDQRGLVPGNFVGASIGTPWAIAMGPTDLGGRWNLVFTSNYAIAQVTNANLVIRFIP